MIKIKKGNKIIWLLPIATSLIGLFFKLSFILILVLISISFIFCLFINSRNPNLLLKEIRISSLPKQKSGIVIGKNNDSLMVTTEPRVLFIDKEQNNDFININIESIVKYQNKPNMIIIDPHQDFINKHYNMLRREDYEITTINLNNAFIDVWGIIKAKINNIKDLESKVSNYKGQYCLSNETYNAYNEIRKNIKNHKQDIIKIIEEFIICYYNLELQTSDFKILKLLLLTMIMFQITNPNIIDLDINKVYDNLMELTSSSLFKIKKVLNNLQDDELDLGETFKNWKVKNNDLMTIIESIKEKTKKLKQELKDKQIITIDGFYLNKRAIFLNGENGEQNKLFLFLLKYAYLDSELYLLLNTDSLYEYTNDALKVIQVIYEFKSMVGLENYLVKVYRGKPNNINKREVLRLCKKEIDEVNSNEYHKIFSLIKLFDKLDLSKEEVLVINPRKGNVITKLQIKKHKEELEFNYSKKN